MTDNPIFRLAQRIDGGLISFEEGMRTASSQSFLELVDDHICREIQGLLESESHLEHSFALILSYLNVICSSAIQADEDVCTDICESHAKVVASGTNFESSQNGLSQVLGSLSKEWWDDVFPSCMFRVGERMRAIGHSDTAIQFYEVARELFSKSGFDVEVAQCYLKTGLAYEHLGHPHLALESYRSAKKLFDLNGRNTDVAVCDENIGDAYELLGKYENARKFYSSSRQAFESEGLETYAADCDVKLGDIALCEGNYDSAVLLFETARETYLQHGMDHEVALCDANMGNALSGRGQYTEAIGVFEQAREYFSREGQQNFVAQADVSMGNSHNYLGNYNQAMKCFRSARSLFAELGRKLDLAKIHMLIGNVHLHLNQYGQSMDQYVSAKMIYTDAGMDVDAARCDANLVLIYGCTGMDDQALYLCKSARQVFEDNGIEREIAWSDMDLGTIYRRKGDYEKAMELFQSARDRFTKMGAEEKTALCESKIASIFALRKQYSRAIELWLAAKEAFLRLRMKSDVAFCDMNVARAHIEMDNHQTALNIMERLFESLGEKTNVEWQFPYTMGLALYGLGRLQKAQSFYALAVETIETSRASLKDERLRTSYLESKTEAFFKMVSTSLDLGDFGKALEYVERLKSRSFAEMLAKQDLSPSGAGEGEKHAFQKFRFRMRSLAHKLDKANPQDRIESFHGETRTDCRPQSDTTPISEPDQDCLDPVQTSHSSYQEIQALATESRRALVEIFPLPNRTAVFIVTEARSIQNSVVIIEDYDQRLLRSQVDRLAQLASNRRHARGDDSPHALNEWELHLENILGELHEKVFTPIEPLLNGIEWITFIPYSDLHLLPLHAMYTELNGKRDYVIDKYFVSYAPSAKVLGHCQTRSRKKKDKLLALQANPSRTAFLPYAMEEVESISQLFHDCKPVIGATRDDIIHHGRSAHIVHFSGHASSKGLLLHSETGSKNEAEYRFDDIVKTLRLPHTYLATLSGCDTGVLDERGMADEYIGLTSAVLLAGAQNVISSLWAVSDISSYLLMKRMYVVIREGKSASEALREALLWLKDPSKRQELLGCLPAWCDWTGRVAGKVASRMRFGPGSIDPEVILPEDLSRPYHWAGWICSGAD